MQSGNTESFLNTTQKTIIILLIIIVIISAVIFKNVFFKPTLLLKEFGKLSVDPEIAFTNTKPTFLEFYAEWCEVCKEMAPKIASIKDEYEDNINFVFLNVDNPKWEKYLRKYNVNGIPQINLFDNQENLKSTFIGKQEEKIIINSLDSLNAPLDEQITFLNSQLTLIKDNKNKKLNPRSH